MDLGTGSGVLAIAAAKLGWDPVLGVDSEEAAVEAARDNAAANGVEIEVLRANLREEVPPLGETVVANLTAPILAEVAAMIAGREDWVPRLLVCSGLLATQAEQVTRRSSEPAFGSAHAATRATGPRWHWSPHERRSRAADRRLRLRGRRPHRAARVPGLAARGGLRLPRRLGPLPLRHPNRGRPARVRRAQHGVPARARCQARRDRLQLGGGCGLSRPRARSPPSAAWR